MPSISRWPRRLRIAATLILVTAGAVALTPGAASAATSGPLAVGQAEPGDINVLSVDATNVNTPVLVRPYLVGAGTAVAKQRWTFEEIPAGGTIPAQTYRIRNASAGKCLEKPLSAGDVDGAAVVIATCQSVTHQYWSIPADYPFGGYQLRSLRDGRCLDLYNSDDGDPVIMWECDGIYSTQLWKVRNGPFDCNDRSVTAMCARPSAPVYGVFATWRQYPVTFTAGEYSDMANYTGWETINFNSPEDSFDYLEVGWRARHDAPTNQTAYDAYWLEQGLVGDDYIYEEYSLADQPGGSAANGRNHAYMALSNDQGQWDILYDYNAVGVTHVASGNRLSYLESGLMTPYPERLTLTAPFEHRIQFLDGNDVWRRVYLGETSGQEQNACGAPPTPLSWNLPNTPPYCFTSTVKSVDGDGVTNLDVYTVAKPTTGALAAVPSAPAPATAATTHNGVDQRTLAKCLAQDASQCLRTVPGLAACVAARKVCNVTVAASPRADARALSPGAFRASAGSVLAADVISRSSSKTVTAAQYRKVAPRALGSLPGDESVVVISGDETVTRIHGRAIRAARGYVLAYDARTGVLLHACLGAACGRP
ncbi:RICIN domain-containing protein [Dactylosporangium sp. NPDC005555]|uniref:RICIN domain-containing protein n=1 Tax=Dactylosporangium sp. NPDC005555 TaxID=3154889 RepID=UPI00339E6D62